MGRQGIYMVVVKTDLQSLFYISSRCCAVVHSIAVALYLDSMYRSYKPLKSHKFSYYKQVTNILNQVF